MIIALSADNYLGIFGRRACVRIDVIHHPDLPSFFLADFMIIRGPGWHSDLSAINLFAAFASLILFQDKKHRADHKY